MPIVPEFRRARYASNARIKCGLLPPSVSCGPRPRFRCASVPTGTADRIRRSPLSRTPRFARRGGNGRYRRVPVVAGAPAKVSSPCFTDLHHHDLRPGEPPEGQLDGGEGNEGGQGFGKVFEVLGETPVSSEPGEGALDHPTVRENDEALRVVARLDDLQAQQRHLCHRSYSLPGVVAAISPDQFEPREAPAYLVEDQPGPVAVLDRGGVGHDPHRQPFAVDQGVDFAALHLLAGVVTHLVVFTAPFPPI